MITASAVGIGSIAHARLLRCFAGALLLGGGLRCSAQPPNAFSAQEDALKAIAHNSLSYVRDTMIPDAMAQANASGTAYRACVVAELMKVTGDYDADKWYKEAIARDDADPTYEFAYAQYLRVYRGALEPLFQKAEAHLFAAERKYACLPEEQRVAYPHAGKDFESVLARAFVDLYQRDGFAIAAPPHTCSTDGRVSLFESLGARAARTNVDFDRNSLIRDLTSGLVLAQSRPPLSFPGAVTPQAFLAAFVRPVTPEGAQERLRLRAGDAPAVDVFAVGQDSGNAQITQFVYNPSRPGTLLYNAVKLFEYGASVDWPFTIFNLADAAITATYRHVRRWGDIEYLPVAREDIGEVDVHGAVSRFVGPDKVNAEFTFVNQSISPRTVNGLNRDRRIYGGTFTYQIFRYGSAYGRKFQNTRGIDLSAGILHDLENYPFTGGVTGVTRQDFFASATIRAFHRFDLNIQPTWFTSDVSTDRFQYNSQYETAGYLLRRIVDEERTGGLPNAWHGLRLGFLNLAVPFHQDSARKGSAVFENYKIGAELDAKWFTSARRGVTFLGSVRYDFQDFYNLNRTFNLFTGSLTMGF